MSGANNTPIDVSFACQRCCQPLKMKSTLSEINEQIVSELSANAKSNEIQFTENKDRNPNVIYKVVPPLRIARQSSLNGNGFIVIEDSNATSLQTTSTEKSSSLGS